MKAHRFFRFAARLALALRCVLLALAWPTIALAGAPSPPSDLFTVYDQNHVIQHQFGVTENGTPLGGAVCIRNDFSDCTPGTEQDANPSAGNYQIWYLPIDGLTDTPTTGTALRAPDGSISDVFFVIGLTDPGFLAFASDSEVGLPISTATTFLNETAGPVDATQYLAATLRDANWTATFQSDVEPAPEPATLALLGIGLAGLGFSRRRTLH